VLGNLTCFFKQKNDIIEAKVNSRPSQSVISRSQIGDDETHLTFPEGVTDMSFERKMFDVTSMNLKCAQCNKEITELPFQPSGSRPVYCRECNKGRAPSGGSRGGGGRGYGGR